MMVPTKPPPPKERRAKVVSEARRVERRMEEAEAWHRRLPGGVEPQSSVGRLFLARRYPQCYPQWIKLSPSARGTGASDPLEKSDRNRFEDVYRQYWRKRQAARGAQDKRGDEEARLRQRRLEDDRMREAERQRRDALRREEDTRMRERERERERELDRRFPNAPRGPRADNRLAASRSERTRVDYNRDRDDRNMEHGQQYLPARLLWSPHYRGRSRSPIRPMARSSSPPQYRQQSPGRRRDPSTNQLYRGYVDSAPTSQQHFEPRSRPSPNQQLVGDRRRPTGIELSSRYDRRPKTRQRSPERRRQGPMSLRHDTHGSTPFKPAPGKELKVKGAASQAQPKPVKAIKERREPNKEPKASKANPENLTKQDDSPAAPETKASNDGAASIPEGKNESPLTSGIPTSESPTKTSPTPSTPKSSLGHLSRSPSNAFYSAQSSLAGSLDVEGVAKVQRTSESNKESGCASPTAAQSAVPDGGSDPLIDSPSAGPVLESERKAIPTVDLTDTNVHHRKGHSLQRGNTSASRDMAADGGAKKGVPVPQSASPGAAARGKVSGKPDGVEIYAKRDASPVPEVKAYNQKRARFDDTQEVGGLNQAAEYVIDREMLRRHVECAEDNCRMWENPALGAAIRRLFDQSSNDKAVEDLLYAMLSSSMTARQESDFCALLKIARMEVANEQSQPVGPVPTNQIGPEILSSPASDGQAVPPSLVMEGVEPRNEQGVQKKDALRKAVESAVGMFYEEGEVPTIEETVRKLCDDSLRNSRLASLLEVMAEGSQDARQISTLQTYFKIARQQIKQAKAESRFSAISPLPQSEAPLSPGLGAWRSPLPGKGVARKTALAMWESESSSSPTGSAVGMAPDTTMDAGHRGRETSTPKVLGKRKFVEETAERVEAEKQTPPVAKGPNSALSEEQGGGKAGHGRGDNPPTDGSARLLDELWDHLNGHIF